MDRKSRRVSRFDPFLASALAGSGGLPPAEEELARLSKAYKFFDEFPVIGSLRTSKAHPVSSDDAPFWLGFGGPAEDWDALIAGEWHDRVGETVAQLDPKPRRVLDIGCGAYAGWILSTAAALGWETSRFVGLDLVPVLVPPSMLDGPVRARVSFVQHNFLEPLPFFDEEFDYVRIACVNSGTPEHRWDSLMEELRRVLAPGGHLELLDTVFSLYAPRPIPRVLHAFERIVRQRFITLDLRTTIPPALAMNELRGISRFSMPILNAPSQRPGKDGHEMSEDEEKARILLAAWSRRIGAHALPLARAVEETYTKAGEVRSERDRSTAEKENEAAVRGWTDELNEIAAVDFLLERKLGWKCKLDEEMERQLSVRVPLIEGELRTLEQAKGSARGVKIRLLGCTTAPVQDIELARQHLQLLKREAEQDLNAVRRRLRLVPLPEPSTKDSLGIFGGEAWVCQK
ncbi:Proteophosphoglycan ppg4 [Rhodotorula toruloides ATCC 204091]|uniref:Proteophosphoglycan ppg4 n=2 Tax=Rhodotorula toruloides TaxID=5286 RepID=A0A2T0A1E0_RHOTO|nr:Proteophosphoglycan ppg4 [Rhodotorula toruloides ATCC 204091]KAK4330081.1 Proteophosphoglycan ppg4 [Rhodotorula toruloides]PRQ71803.1 Proteophosphoglycan ppg4 [Rhodotorula toruloides]